MAQDRVKWWALVSAVLNHSVSKNISSLSPAINIYTERHVSVPSETASSVSLLHILLPFFLLAFCSRTTCLSSCVGFFPITCTFIPYVILDLDPSILPLQFWIYLFTRGVITGLSQNFTP
jgi:hypothetical protein